MSRFFCILSVALLAACDFPFMKDGQVVVSVGETKLYESDIRAMAPEWDSWNDRSKLAFLEHWINEETIYQEAEKNGALNDSALQSQIQQTVRKMVVDHFLQSFADTMMVGDAERLDYYKNHQDLFLRGKTMASGAILSFREWGNGSTYYRGHKDMVYDSMPNPHYLIKSITTFDSVTVSPDTCIIPSITEATVGKITPMKVCGNSLKIGLVVSRLDSADVLPYAEVAEDVAARAWVEHQKIVMDRLKKEWKNARPIFSKVNVFSEKDEQ